MRRLRSEADRGPRQGSPPRRPPRRWRPSSTSATRFTYGGHLVEKPGTVIDIEGSEGKRCAGRSGSYPPSNRHTFRGVRSSPAGCSGSPAPPTGAAGTQRPLQLALNAVWLPPHLRRGAGGGLPPRARCLSEKERAERLAELEEKYARLSSWFVTVEVLVSLT